ncbi:Serine/Threonine protein kinase [Orpheovirus IHUMI-LCC2]|uniref:Serine/Threonine protein kinase n=1 Tax=Orpheovirus IHUMI-LCC2 TaxID=2023057 RepID=A0A2I2L3A4_9VIRU|nr:Serine/Threonine protein kinase [Orpheovirus IHUMI-LCC2]SNW62018.1 Serine/Threonine protein kinase [Orpheovirus IHUMI-LCC2]
MNFNSLRNLVIFSFLALSASALTVRKFELGPSVYPGDGLGTVSLSLDGCGIVANPTFNQIVKYCPATNSSVTYQLPGDEFYPTSALQDYSGRFHFISSYSQALSVYDPSDNSVQTQHFDGETLPNYLSVAPDGNVYVTLSNANKLVVYPLNTENLTTDLRFVNVSYNGPEKVLYNLLNGRLCVTMVRSGSIVCYDDNWNELVIPVAGYPTGLTLTLNGSLCFSYNNGAYGNVGCVSAFCRTSSCLQYTRTDLSLGYDNRVDDLTIAPGTTQLFALMSITNAAARINKNGTWNRLDIFDPVPFEGLRGPDSVSLVWTGSKLGTLVSTASSKTLYTVTF